MPPHNAPRGKMDACVLARSVVALTTEAVCGLAGNAFDPQVVANMRLSGYRLPSRRRC